MDTSATRDRYVIAVDLGTLSRRAIVVRTHDVATLASALTQYRCGVIEPPSNGAAPPMEWALQHPHDYVDTLRSAAPPGVRAAESTLPRPSGPEPISQPARFFPCSQTEGRYASIRRWGIARTPPSNCGSITPPNARLIESVRVWIPVAGATDCGEGHSQPESSDCRYDGCARG